MESLIQADIFFLITTIVVILLTAGIALVLTRVFMILNDIRHITASIKNAAELLVADVTDLRNDWKTKGFRFNTIMQIIRLITRRRKTSRKTRAEQESEEL